ncbi:MAG: tRNA (adenosine(37)-N6)-threonylcarbamoyltransferase complex ATPase subunit type 1 TsaE [Candidatus Omnitrophica bacterium]|nr:tRNA (adenosine(37)-N6)-threonylcarbamoyltransferase complex ATPase subunit type 1 TsaE [Candidatus Omnitrophota bacterium]
MNSDFEANLQVQELQAWARSGAKSKLIMVCGDVDETLGLAQSFSQILKGGDAVALQGTLGSGKTVFVKGLALGLGLAHADEVKSPTFVLMHVYPTRIPLYHFDLYRLEEDKELEAIGFEDFVSDPKAICCVEWAEKGIRYFPKSTYRVHLEILRDTERKITIEK